MSGPTFVVHIAADGGVDYRAFGSVDGRFLVIDERCPDDRVYRITARSLSAELTALIGSSPIGDRFDDRHGAMAALVRAAADRVSHLTLVDG